MDSDNVKKDAAVNDALLIATIVNKHLAETECNHNIKQIMAEIFQN